MHAEEDADNEEQHNERFDGIVEPVVVLHNHRAVDTHVAQRVGGVHLYGLAKEVLHDALALRSGGVNPVEKGRVGNRLMPHLRHPFTVGLVGFFPLWVLSCGYFANVLVQNFLWLLYRLDLPQA